MSHRSSHGAGHEGAQALSALGRWPAACPGHAALGRPCRCRFDLFSLCSGGQQVNQAPWWYCFMGAPDIIAGCTLPDKKTSCIQLDLSFSWQGSFSACLGIVVRQRARVRFAATRNPGRHGCWRQQCAAFLTQFLTCCLRLARISAKV